MALQAKMMLYADDGLAAYGFPAGHPLGVDRQGAFLRAARALGLLARAGSGASRLASREELMRESRIDSNARAVDVQVTRLRRKIEPDPKLPRYLQTVRGAGYVLRPD